MDNPRSVILDALNLVVGGVGDSIPDSTSLTKDLGMDSLDKIEFVMTIERDHNLVIPDQDSEDLDTIGEWVDYLSNR